MQTLHPIYEKFVLNEKNWIENDFSKLLMNDLYLLYHNKHPGFDQYVLSDQVIDKVNYLFLNITLNI